MPIKTYYTDSKLYIPGIGAPSLKISCGIEYTFFPAYNKSMKESIRIESIRLQFNKSLDMGKGKDRSIEVIGTLTPLAMKRLEMHILKKIRKKGVDFML